MTHQCSQCRAEKPPGKYRMCEACLAKKRAMLRRMICKRCDEVFYRGGGHRSYCSSECRADAFAEYNAAHPGERIGYEPTEDEIAKVVATIQSGWTPEERASRARWCHSGPLETMVMPAVVYANGKGVGHG